MFKAGGTGHRLWAVLLLLFTIHYSLFSNVYAFCFEEAGREYGISPQLLKTIAMTESNFKTDALNKNNNGTLDIGLMQINSFWIKILGLNANELISNPCYNTMIGAKILRQCIDRYGYTWEAVGCYNAASSHKRVSYSWKIFNKLKAEDKKLRRLEDKRKTENEKFLTSQPLNFSTSNPQDSEFYFRVRDRMSSHEQSSASGGVNHEIKPEAQ
jgi:hypothetical protein